MSPEVNVPNAKGKGVEPTAPHPVKGKQTPKEFKNRDAEEAPDDDDLGMGLPTKVPSTKRKDAKPTASPPMNGKHAPIELENGNAKQSPEEDDPKWNCHRFQLPKGQVLN